MKKYLFITKKGFSGFALLLFGVTGVLPPASPLDTEQLNFSENADNPVEISSSVKRLELCRWQKDFIFFNELGEKKQTVQKTPSCVIEEDAFVALSREKENFVVEEGVGSLIREMTAGYPLEIMAPVIAEYDRGVAALIVGIAKKESNWGKRSPRSPDGADCFNYWGFKGAGSRGTAMGHGCFGSPEEAVRAVGNRIAELVKLRQTSEPKNMTIWKCGSSCATHSPESVSKWIADIDLYYRKIVQN